MKNVKTLIAVVLALVLSLTCLAGCAQPEAGAAVEIAPGGILCLKVNPEIAVSYDAEGKVTAVTARNADAQKILENYKSFEGKEAKAVVVELVDLIGNAGYFVEELEGERRQITLEIEPGSSLPSGTFLNDVIADVKEVVSSNNWSVPLDVQGESEFGITNYVDTDYGVGNDGVTDYGKTDYNDPTDYGKTDYDATDYGATAQPAEPAATEPAAAAKDDSAAAASKDSGNKTSVGKTDYTDYNDKTDYGKTDYNDKTDYGKTDYDATDYGASNQKPAATEPAATEPVASGSGKNTDYNDPTDYGKTDYNDKTDYGKTDYNEKTDYGKTDYNDKTDYN